MHKTEKSLRVEADSTSLEAVKSLLREVYRPYALTSRLHNNDAMLGVKTCLAAHTCQCAGPTGPAVWHAGVGPLAACLAMAHLAVPRLTPNTRGRPSVTSYAYGLFLSSIFVRQEVFTCTTLYFKIYAQVFMEFDWHAFGQT